MKGPIEQETGEFIRFSSVADRFDRDPRFRHDMLETGRDRATMEDYEWFGREAIQLKSDIAELPESDIPEGDARYDFGVGRRSRQERKPITRSSGLRKCRG